MPNTPLIKLEENANAPVLRYDVPEPTSYSGTNFIRLDFDDQVFLGIAMEKTDVVDEVASRSKDTVKTQLNQFLNTGINQLGLIGSSGGLLINPELPPIIPDDSPGQPGPAPLPNNPPLKVPIDLTIDGLAQKVKDGERIVVTENPNGDPSIETIPVPEEAEPGLYLIETLRLTSFLGNYGAGRVVKTFSLLPGENTKISIKTFKQREATSKKSSSVLDSVTTESADDFQNSLQEEQSNQKAFQNSKEYYADVKAKARWGWGSASAKAGIKGSTNAAREESVKNISNATESHTSKASSKRDIEINTSAEITEKEGEETSIEREIENINLSRTLNFVFRQMNQEFLVFTHLTDIRIGFFNGFRESKLEVAISDLDSLLDQVVEPASLDAVKEGITEQLKSIRDINGELIDPIKESIFGPDDAYIAFDRSIVSEHTDPDSGRTYKVPGVLLNADKRVMRTEGVIVESILGEGLALDEYAVELQKGEVAKLQQSVRKASAEADQSELINDAVSSESDKKAELLEKLICPCEPRESMSDADAG